MRKLLFIISFSLISIFSQAQDMSKRENNIPMSFYLDNGPVDPSPMFFTICFRLWENSVPAIGPPCYCCKIGICEAHFGPCDYNIIGREVKYYFDPSLISSDNYINLYFRESTEGISPADLMFKLHENVSLKPDGSYYFTSGNYTYDSTLGEFGGFKILVGHNE